jgi:hypothetical protein
MKYCIITYQNRRQKNRGQRIPVPRIKLLKVALKKTGCGKHYLRHNFHPLLFKRKSNLLH